MRNTGKKLCAAVLAGALMLGASGCFYGMSSYGRYQNQIKTTASPENIEEITLAELWQGEYFELKGLPWGSTLAQFEEFLGTTVRETNSFTEGESMADVNYCYKLADAVTVGVQPVFNKEGGLMSISLYYQTTYTSEQLDEIYERLVPLAEKEFGERENETSEETTSNRVTYTTTVSYWYAEKSENEVTSLQIGKLNNGGGTEAVVVGINCYDPALLEQETETAEAE